jgi:hypothetical protein
MQQIEAARLDDGDHSPNPYPAALGIAGMVAATALLFLLWPIIDTLVCFARYALDCAIFLISPTHSVRWLGKAAFEPGAKIALAFTAALFCIFACRSILRVGNALAAFARRGRA